MAGTMSQFHCVFSDTAVPSARGIPLFSASARRPPWLLPPSLSSSPSFSAAAGASSYPLRPCSFPLRLHAIRSLSVATAAAAAAAAASTQEILTAPDADVEVDTRIPATIITGFLGSGKTTLLNYVLNEHHGKRIAIIENEFGEIDIDGSLVASKSTGVEDIVMLNNGCLCCTVRGDLVRMMSELIEKKRDKFDHILIETTGLANPSPIIQTFYAEEEILENIKLDGVVTLVDAKHAPYHLDQVKPDGVVNEAVEQIAYADRIILNKIDLVGDSQLKELVQRIKNINGLARLQHTKYGVVDIDYVLGIGGFDLERVESDIKEETSKKQHMDDQLHDADHKCDENCKHDHDHDHHHDHDHSTHAHMHDPGVSSVSIVSDGNLELQKIYDWLDKLLGEKSQDIYRMKGVLAIEGVQQRFVFQGVHSLFEGGPDRLWGSDEKRTNKIVFIGRNLDREILQSGFEACKFVEKYAQSK